MLNQILELLEKINPPHLFSKIEASKDEISLTINKDYWDLRDHKIIRMHFHPNSISVHKDDQFKGIATSPEDCLKLIYRSLNCKLVELEFDEVLYDVWGNEEDGFQVNDQSKWGITEEVCIHIPSMSILCNKKDIGKIFKIEDRTLDIEWSDYGIPLNDTKYFEFGYYFSQSSNGKPIGEIRIAYDKKNIDLLNSLR